jgi:hypothetical protein
LSLISFIQTKTLHPYKSRKQNIENLFIYIYVSVNN